MTRQQFVDVIQGVNNKYSRLEVYHPRWLTTSLQEASRNYPVTVLTGARQVGKTTLLLNADPFCHWRFRTLDDFDVLAQAKQDPQALWAGADEVALDEVQKAPELLQAIKIAVDRNPGKYHFVLSGSA